MELHQKISINSPAGIRPAAEALRDAAHAMANLRVAVCANIASKDPMVDVARKFICGYTAAEVAPPSDSLSGSDMEGNRSRIIVEESGILRR